MKKVEVVEEGWSASIVGAGAVLVATEAWVEALDEREKSMRVFGKMNLSYFDHHSSSPAMSMLG